MSPRKSPQGKVEKWAYDMYQQKTRTLLTGPYTCPICAETTFVITIDKKRKEVTGKCACGLNDKVKFFEAYQPIDYYNKLVDKLRTR